jgi:hypothetical protein
VSQPRHGHRAHGAQLHSLDPFRFPPEWSAAPVAPSFPDRPPPSTLSDDRRIPPARCPCAPQAREIPRPAPDAYSAGTRNRGGAVHKVTAPPHHSAPRDRRSTRTRRLGACKGRPPYAPSKSYWLAQRVVEVDHVLHHRGMLDRLLHHCHIVVTDGDSYRMKQARERRRPKSPDQPRGVGTSNWPPAGTTLRPLTPASAQRTGNLHRA